MSPELPYLGAGVVALIGGVRREGKLPSKGLQGLVATVVLVLVASALGNTKAAPLVRAVGVLVLTASVYGAVRVFQEKPAVPSSVKTSVAKITSPSATRTPGNSNAASGFPSRKTTGTKKAPGAGKGVGGGGGGGF